MCGLLGLVGIEAVDVERVLALAPQLAHRGPDDSGWLTWSPESLLRDGCDPPERARVVLAHRRLSVLDLSPRGHQPMSTADGRFHLVFNGEVYNYAELRTELEALGQRFVSEGDTEVVLGAWAAWGPAACSRFVGMFALAVLDTERETLTLARDPFGIKPLFVRRHADLLGFASEIPTLLELSDAPRRARAQSLYRFLRYGLADHGAHTAFEGVEQVPAGHWVQVDLGTLETRRVRYWAPPTEVSQLSYGEAQERVREVFLRSVRLHLRSDVRVGAALSGGIDSSAIVGAIRALQPDTELHTFTYVPEAGSGVPSEERWAAQVAAHAGAIRHTVTPTAAELAADLDGLIRTQAEPFLSLSLYAQARVFRLAREAGVTVLLDGQGADELLGGYAHLQGARLASLVAGADVRGAAHFARAAHRSWGLSYGQLLRGAGQRLLPERVLRRGRARDPQWLQASWFRGAGVETAPHPEGGRDGRHLHAALRRALQSDLLPALLRYEDRNSMAYSLESRVPFLSVELAELLLSLPESFLVDRDARSKSVFRDAMRGLVPEPVLARRDKVGFVASDRAWLVSARGWVEETLELARDVPAIDAQGLAKAWRQAQTGPWPGDLWRALNVVRWWHLFGLRH